MTLLAQLAANRIHPHDVGMFLVTDADAAAIREAYDRAGELAAVIELRRRFSGIANNEHARRCARSIAGWEPLPKPPATVTRLHPSKD